LFWGLWTAGLEPNFLVAVSFENPTSNRGTYYCFLLPRCVSCCRAHAPKRENLSHRNRARAQFRMATARLRGECGAQCAYCLEEVALPDSRKRPRGTCLDGPIATCSRCLQSVHSVCMEGEFNVWVQSLNSSSMWYQQRCPNCRARLYSIDGDLPIEAKVTYMPRQRERSLSLQIKDVRKDVERGQEQLEKIKAFVATCEGEYGPDHWKCRAAPRLMRLMEHRLERDMRQLALLERRFAARMRRQTLRSQAPRRLGKKKSTG
jgi:hypothetical protein